MTTITIGPRRHKRYDYNSGENGENSLFEKQGKVKNPSAEGRRPEVIEILHSAADGLWSHGGGDGAQPFEVLK
ncbi:hypothetical protein SNOG_14102 [Parastagonospora nodorum SN15]|uniref:Uncharacterized protein n=1 Tax=Phaeosphaeria nodorum (strain SN15 / ATCC MYA-4574 / FGSC 10173) TaxID=321614 RepID=Q0U1T6_PHANO|nr:hypothetical protein SNOG_14102 [Parastagonospora nodorum SN15]EAT78339.1 hypothetical protein SNOG_14102 [Parastagonospora nodorum SN15]